MTFWHLAEPDSMLLHSVFLGKGIYTTASVSAQAPGMEGVGTLYSILHADKEKESYWEEVRAERFPERVTRMKTLYACTSEADAEKANSEWFGGKRLALRLELGHAYVSICDSRLLNGTKEQWPMLAEQYWSLQQTADPMLEAIIHGIVYFPEWEKPPFGFGVGILKPAPR